MSSTEKDLASDFNSTAENVLTATTGQGINKRPGEEFTSATTASDARSRPVRQRFDKSKMTDDEQREQTRIWAQSTAHKAPPPKKPKKRNKKAPEKAAAAAGAAAAVVPAAAAAAPPVDAATSDGNVNNSPPSTPPSASGHEDAVDKLGIVDGVDRRVFDNNKNTLQALQNDGYTWGQQADDQGSSIAGGGGGSVTVSFFSLSFFKGYPSEVGGSPRR